MNRALVLQSDFGISDGAVSAMYGVAFSVDSAIRIFDLTHDIPPFNIWEGSYRLLQAISYWPEGTVFVSVVDPGVGSARKSVAVKTKDGKIIITPNNGTLTHIHRFIGIVEARELDEEKNRLPHSRESYTFHGRDIFAYTGARLAMGKISFEQIGKEIEVSSIVSLPLNQATRTEGSIDGIIEIHDVRFGNLWTNINRDLLREAGIQYGDRLSVTIGNGTRQVYKNTMTFGRSFADTLVGEPLVYINSLDNLAIAINQGSFADAFHIGSGTNWTISFLSKEVNHGS
ncbi:DNA-directed RNA polymerase subunit delta [Bacillus sp. FJAT-18017]|uniref:SAM hydrolase/SAM-dependent halogenase family protein n=1 Tax=Bacillus sp. FJAT-18017 TaxID=1705566 RepID=UPI0006AE623B|nr:S-adenosyl-l-methionine hydroxide adenosyltransferase family protein [Bacillus sp. FJAT-18017]ALC92155.1 DNA-directed RNA polymerase subunit delta [Bacillus sp. FJAT-18017]